MSVEEKLQRLKGLTIGISAPGSGTATIFRKMLIARGMQPDTWLTLTPVGGAAPSLAAFEQGLVDGVVYPAPVPEIIENKGIGKTVIDGFKEKIAEVSGVPYLVLATSQETLKKKPELIAGAIRALANAMAFAHNNPSKIPALIRPYFKNTDDAIYSKMVESYRKASAISPYITPQQVENTEKWMSIGTGQSISVKYESVVSAEPAKTISSKMSIH
jgi:NitT/TauT family transport system substrate-binding protein